MADVVKRLAPGSWLCLACRERWDIKLGSRLPSGIEVYRCADCGREVDREGWFVVSARPMVKRERDPEWGL